MPGHGAGTVQGGITIPPFVGIVIVDDVKT
jgi:hypothetical protein